MNNKLLQNTSELQYPRGMKTHILDLTRYPIESHADLLMFFQVELQTWRIASTDRIVSVISKIQERSLLLELNEQLKDQEDYAMMPALTIKACNGHPLEVR